MKRVGGGICRYHISERAAYSEICCVLCGGLFMYSAVVGAIT
jgi:hypothetical protein